MLLFFAKLYSYLPSIRYPKSHTVSRAIYSPTIQLTLGQVECMVYYIIATEHTRDMALTTTRRAVELFILYVIIQLISVSALVYCCGWRLDAIAWPLSSHEASVVQSQGCEVAQWRIWRTEYMLGTSLVCFWQDYFIIFDYFIFIFIPCLGWCFSCNIILN